MFYLKYIIQKVEHATHFATTSLCDIEELREICITSSLGTFGYIVHNRYRCPTDLVFEAPVFKSSVRVYTFFTKIRASFQTLNSSNLLILSIVKKSLVVRHWTFDDVKRWVPPNA